MTLYRRGRIYWAYRWINGVRHAKSTRSSNRRQAEIIEQKFKDELNLKRHYLTQLQPEMRFAELVAKFLSEAEVKPYHLDRLKMLLPFFENMAIGEITKGVARRFRQERKRQRQLVLSNGKHPKPVKPLTETTLNRDLECLRHILYWATDEGYLVANPLSRMRLERERKRKRPVLSLEEEELLLGAAAPHLRQIITVALDAGMRRGEIFSQRWEDVDFARGLLFVSHSKTAEGEAREIPLTMRLVNLLSTMKKSEGLVFTFEGKPLRSTKTAWKAAIRRSGIRYMSFHRTRHTFNTRLMEAGVMREVRMALMGHSLGDDPQADYTHVELPAKREAIRKLELWRAEQEKQLSGHAQRSESTTMNRTQLTERIDDVGTTQKGEK